MSVVSMQKILICGPLEEREAVMKELQREGCLHLTPLTTPPDALSSPENREALSRAEKNAQLAEAALKVLDEYAPEKGGLFSSLAGGSELTFEEWQGRAGEKEEALKDAEKLIEKQKKIADAQAAASRAEVLSASLEPWMGLDIPLNTSGTESCGILIGALPGVWTEDAIRSLLSNAFPLVDAYALEMLQGDNTQTPFALMCLKEDAPGIEELLRKNGFARPVISSGKTPTEAREDLQFERASAVSEAEECKAAIRVLARGREKIKFLADDARLEAGRLKGLSRSEESERSFFLSGYVPSERFEALKKKLEEKFTLSLEPLEAEKDEDAPILLKNRRLSAPTEGVVESYGLPGKGEVDPTGIMAFFYYFLFGLMLSDAGYGLVMVIGCAILLKKFPKMSRGMKKTFTMFFWCGVSTTIWGILFGGFFGDAIDQVAHTFFNVPKDVTVFKPLWFAPLEKPMKLLVYSFLFGLIHLFVGLGIKGYQLLKKKAWMEFFGGVFCWFLLLLGLVFLLVPSDIFASIAGGKITLPPVFTSIAGPMALLGAAGIVLFSAADKKNIGLRIALGAYDLYGVTGWLSDVLSYSRLLALGLATGVIASVFNTMGTMFGNGVIGAVLFVIIFLVGHTLNLAINLLGAYVHTNRLQYVEFFGKFYDGGGTPFEPLATQNTKYYHMEDK